MDNLSPEEKLVLSATVDCGRAVIAGGWVRDYLMGNKPRDMDLWLISGSQESMDFIIRDIVKLCIESDCRFEFLDTKEPGNEASGAGRVECVTKFRVNDYEFDLIVPCENTLHELLDSFDFDVNKVAIKRGAESRRYELRSVPGAVRAIFNKQATRTRREHDEDRALARNAKMQQRGFNVTDEVTVWTKELLDNIPF